MVIDSEIPDTQRVLILQGGGALGAYEAGAFKALSEELPKLDAKKGEPSRPLFVIIAGTSIGAINAAILLAISKSIIEAGMEHLKNSRNFGILFLLIQIDLSTLKSVGGNRIMKMIIMPLHLKLPDDIIPQSTF